MFRRISDQSKKITSRGFTLLEVLIAIAILSMSLMVIYQTQGRAVQMANYGKFMSVATLLVRTKIIEIEEQLKEEGFSDFDDEKEGTFEEEGFDKFRWLANIKKITINLPESLSTSGGGLSGMGGGGDQKDGASNKQQMGMNLAMLGPHLKTIAKILEQSVRELKITVFWPSGPKKENSINVTTHVVDFKKAGLVSGGTKNLPSLNKK